MKCRIGIDTAILSPSLDPKDIKQWNWDYGYITEELLPKELDSNQMLKWVEASCNHNLAVCERCLNWVNKSSKQYKTTSLKFYRLPTSLLPYYTFRWASWIYKRIMPSLTKKLDKLGQYARKHHIRLTFHAPMTTVLNSTKPYVVDSSVYTLEQLTKIFFYMGYPCEFHPNGCGITTHIGGFEGGEIEGINRYVLGLTKLKNAQKFIQVENDDRHYRLNNLLDIGIPVVLDLHHYWILENGHYKFQNVDKIFKTWKSIRPKIHVSMPKRELIEWSYFDNVVGGKFIANNLPNKKEITTKVALQKLRPHGDIIYGESMKKYISEFAKDFDIMVEMKGYSVASEKLCDYIDRLKV